jgi:DNA polymerase-3 subunit chi
MTVEYDATPSTKPAPQVDFYILPDSDAQQRTLFACRLIEKVYRLRHPLYVHSGDRAQAERLDALLWQQPASGFIPHELLAGTGSGSTAVQLGWDGVAPDPARLGDRAVLINLADSVPAFFDSFARVSEIVVQVPAILAATRTAWRYYQQRGCALERHDLRTGQR